MTPQVNSSNEGSSSDDEYYNNFSKYKAKALKKPNERRKYASNCQKNEKQEASQKKTDLLASQSTEEIQGRKGGA